LNSKSTIKDNYNIEEYYNYDTDKFDYVSREKDIFENLYENVFPYNPYIYGINETQIKNYYDNYELVKNDKDLLEILKLKGIHFENFLKNNPLYIEQYKKYRELLRSEERRVGKDWNNGR